MSKSRECMQLMIICAIWVNTSKSLATVIISSVLSCAFAIEMVFWLIKGD